MFNHSFVSTVNFFYDQPFDITVSLAATAHAWGPDYGLDSESEADLFHSSSLDWIELPVGTSLSTVSGHAYLLAPIPIPAAVWLLGTGLIGLIGIARRRSA